MKKFIFFCLFTATLNISAQTSDYKVSSYFTKGNKAPNTHYIGEAWLNQVLRANGDLTYNITKATFKANSTLDWHKHESENTLMQKQNLKYEYIEIHEHNEWGTEIQY